MNGFDIATTAVSSRNLEFYTLHQEAFSITVPKYSGIIISKVAFEKSMSFGLDSVNSKSSKIRATSFANS